MTIDRKVSQPSAITRTTCGITKHEEPLEPFQLNRLVHCPAACDRKDAEHRHGQVGDALQRVVFGLVERMRPGAAQQSGRDHAEVIPQHRKGTREVGAAREQCLEPTSQCETDRVEESDRHEEVSEQPMQSQRWRQTKRAQTEMVVEPGTRIDCGPRQQMRDQDAEIRQVLRAASGGIDRVLVDRRSPMNGKAAGDESEKHRYGRPVCQTNQRMVPDDSRSAARDRLWPPRGERP